MMSFKEIMNMEYGIWNMEYEYEYEYGNLLSSLSTDQANIPDLMDFIIHVIYNRPNCEKSPGDSIGYSGDF